MHHLQVTKTAMQNHAEFRQSVGEGKTPNGKWVRDRHRPSAQMRTGKAMCQRCPHSLVMGKSPDSIQETTSQPLDDTSQAQGTQTRQLALCRCHTSFTLSEEVRHVAISERAGDAHSLTPCDNWTHCPRRRKCQAQHVRYCLQSAGPDT